jgi:hypothetical protein
MNLLLRLGSFVALLFFSALLLIFFLDVYSVLSDPESYRIAQGFTPPELSWKSPEVLKYIAKNLPRLIVAAIGLPLSIRYLQGKLGDRTRKVYWGLVLTSFLVVLLGYFKWASTGFDH